MLLGLFRLLSFLTEKRMLVELLLIVAGLVSAFLSVLYGAFVLGPLLIVYLLLVLFLPSLIYLAAVLFGLIVFDLYLARKPSLTILAPSNAASVRARVMRLLVEKQLKPLSLSSFSFFFFGLERRLLNFFQSRLGSSWPYVVFCKEPLLVVRLWPISASSMVAQKTNVAIIAEEDIRAQTLAKNIETTVKYSSNSQ